MPKPACRLGDQANCPADSHGNGGGSMRAALATLALFLSLLWPCTGLAADAAQQEIGYTIFKGYTGRTASTKNTNVNIHPHLEEEIGTDDFFVVSVQEHDILKIAVYRDKEFQSLHSVLYTYNNLRIDYTGVPACYMGDHIGECIKFSDGTILHGYFPPDAREMGTSGWMYEMRWRRIYKNYYLITFFRGGGNVIQEDLMTEKDGKDMTPILGDSSVDRDLKQFGGCITGDDKYIETREEINGKSVYTKFRLIPVHEKDLPPDFPKGLVRWFP